MLKVHNKDPVKQTKQYMFMVVNLPRRLLNVLSTLNPVSRSVLNVMLEWFEINPKDPRKTSNEFFLDHALIPSSNIYLFKFNSRITRKRCEILSKLTIKTSELQLTSFWCFQSSVVFLVQCPVSHFSPVSHFYTPSKRQKTFGFQTFSGGIEM